MFSAYLIQILPGWQPKSTQKVQDFQGGFLLKPLKNSTRIFVVGEEAGWQFEVIEFFSDSTTVPIHFAYAYNCGSGQALSVEDFDRMLGGKLGKSATFGSLRMRVVWTDDPLEARIGDISQFLRGSNSLTAQEFALLNNLRYVADGKGFAVVGFAAGSDRQLRLLQAVCLVCAYQVAMNNATESLSLAASNPNISERKLLEWSIFLARYYSAEPVLSTTIELTHFYAAIRDRLRIGSQYQELTEQLRLFAEIVATNRREADSYRAAQAQKRFTWLGLLVAVVGLLVAVVGMLAAMLAVPPQQAAETSKKWWGCVQMGWSKCSSSEKVEKDTPVQPTQRQLSKKSQR